MTVFLCCMFPGAIWEVSLILLGV